MKKGVFFVFEKESVYPPQLVAASFTRTQDSESPQSRSSVSSINST